MNSVSSIVVDIAITIVVCSFAVMVVIGFGMIIYGLWRIVRMGS